jgi:hypothetical protein
MLIEHKEWVILGITVDGDVFDVPYWTDRLCGMLSEHSANKKLSYSSYLTPSHIGNLPAVIVQNSLAHDDPDAFAIISNFVSENKLKTRAGRSADPTGDIPAIQTERREYFKG